MAFWIKLALTFSLLFTAACDKTEFTPIEFVNGYDPDEGILAVCLFPDYAWEGRVIHIYNESWPQLTFEEQAFLIRHERGHCDYNLEHDNALHDDGCPVSLMHEYIPRQECIDLHRDQYTMDYNEEIISQITSLQGAIQ